MPWDLAILDEAHRLRNVYKPGAKTALAIRAALSNTPKLLLTATPLQNSLMELYGLVSMIDEHHFGDAKSFQAQYSRLAQDGRFEDLKARLEPVCHRTLRRQVVEYVSYTNRVSDHAGVLAVGGRAEALRRGLRLPPAAGAAGSADQSAHAHGARDAQAPRVVDLRDRRRARLARTQAADRPTRRRSREVNATPAVELEDAFEGDFESLAEEQEEWQDPDAEPEPPPTPLTEAQRAAIAAEIAELGAFRDLAVSITENAKGLALLTALETGFAKAAALGAADKAVIFTESRRTQEYLIGLLSRSGYEDQIVLFNGSNNDPTSKADLPRLEGSGTPGAIRSPGRRQPTCARRSSSSFRTTSKIMIATEAAAEGINLQFCSMVVNYDLPWNPQRIEQRIGRCHRYGQKHDVVVINFLNKANAADLRVFELLDEKFRLFSGVFGASDDVLGTIESGVDFERRIIDIYQNLPHHRRDQRAVRAAPATSLTTQITETMDNTRLKLLEHFDAEVHDRLRVSLAESTEFIDKASEQLWRVTSHILRDHAEIDPAARTFSLTTLPRFAPDDTALGRYRLSWDEDEDAHRYRPQHPLALAVLGAAAKLDTPCTELIFNYSAWPIRSELLAPLVGFAGTLVAEHLQLNGVEAEDHLILAAVTDDGRSLTAEQTRRLFDVPATAREASTDDLSPAVAKLANQRVEALREDISARQGSWFDDEMDKLDRWAEDKRTGLKAVSPRA